MRCPKCGNEMETGYVSSAGNPIVWTQQKRKWFTFAEGSEIQLCGLSFGKGLPAHICKPCRKVIIDY